MPNKKEYLDAVCGEIRFTAARKVLRAELSAHIDDKKAELENSGTPDAETVAIGAMGDARQVGKAFNAVHKPRTEWGVILCVLLLGIAGYFSLQAGMTDYTENSAFGSIIVLHSNPYTIALWPVIIGFCAFIVAYFANYSLMLRLRYVTFFGALAYIAIRLYLIKQMGSLDKPLRSTYPRCSLY